MGNTLKEVIAKEEAIAKELQEGGTPQAGAEKNGGDGDKPGRKAGEDEKGGSNSEEAAKR